MAGAWRAAQTTTILFLAVWAICGARSASAQLVARTITIAWDASEGTDVAGYRVRYGTQSGQYSHTIDVGNQTTADLPNLIDGTSYFFVVTAYNSAGIESEPSQELTHTPNPAMFLNMSTRARVQGGDAVVISGFIIGGSSRKTVVIRATGPSLAALGVNDVLADPTIELHGMNGLIAANDNWRDGDADALERLQLAPASDLEAALVVTLVPGSYSVILRGRNDTEGIALLEVYDGGIPPAP